MACKNCPKEGQTDKPQLVVGFRIWYSNGLVATGTTFDDWKVLPSDGVLAIMLYYDRFDTAGEVRYRRVIQGDDQYWVSPGVLDVIYGQGNQTDLQIIERYPGCSVKHGIWTDDAHYKQVVSAAMNNYNVSDFGITPVDGTSDS